MSDQPKPRPRAPVPSRILTWWFGLMAAAGVAFGLFGDKHSFGDDILAHPVVVLFILVGVALLIARFVLRRPIPGFIPVRLLLFGCFVGLAAFLIGNWFAVNLLAIR